MIPINHCVAALYTAARMAKLDAEAAKDFDTSPQGFYRSFYAAAFVAPLLLVMNVARWSQIDATDVIGRYIAVEIIAYVIAWTAFPVVMITLSRFLGCAKHYARGIIACNWAAVLQHLVYTPVAVASIGGGFGMLAFFVLLAVLFYSWFVVRSGFNLSSWAAFGLVGLDLLIGIVINYWSDRLIFG